MKKMSMCILVLGLAASDFFASPVSWGWEFFEMFSEDGVKHLQDELKDAEKLERHLSVFFMGRDFGYDTPRLFKQRFGVSDEVMRTALMNIVRESSEKAGWQIEDDGRRDEPTFMARWLLISAISWLGVCADTGEKNFLLDIATDDTRHIVYRGEAIRAFLRSADAQGARDMLVRFLAGDMRATVDPYRIYIGCMQAYDEAVGDPLKREAIIASLIVALAREENRGLFAEMDKEFAKRSKEYATSHQRLAMLQRMSKLPPSNWYGDSGKTLDPALKSFRFRFVKTNVSTNLTELMACDFSASSSAVRDSHLTTLDPKNDSIRKELKDAKKLKEYAANIALASGRSRYIWPEQMEDIKRVSGLNDKTIESAFLGVIREWSATTGWGSWDARIHGPRDARIGHMHLCGAIRWLGVCADVKGKKALTDIFIDNAKDGEFRSPAIDSYMRRADPKERRDMIARLLADDMRPGVLPFFDVYHAAMMEYDKAEGDTQTREAIAAAMSAALAREQDKDTFERADKMLAERSAEWAGSPQRKAALERFGKPPAPEAP